MRRAILERALAALIPMGLAASAFCQVTLFSSGAPEEVTDIPGLDPGFYGSQSVFGTYFYNTPANVPPPLNYRARADYFDVSVGASVTEIVFWGFLDFFGGDQREIHIKVMTVDASTGLPTGTAFTANSAPLAYTGWGPFEESADDPTGSLMSRWRFRIGDLNVTGNTHLDPGVYALMIASDDQGSELYWSINAPHGKVGGVFDKQLVALNNDGMNWAQEDAGFGSRINKQCFEVIGYTAQGDANGDGCIDDSDLTAMILDYGSTGPFPTVNGNTDADGSGEVDDADLTLVVLNFGVGC